MRDQLSVFILTLDEEANLERTLDAVSWAPRVLVVDSGSRDETLAITARHDNVSVVHRQFDDHAGQANFALRHGEEHTPWVLALDADFVVTPELRDRICSLDPGTDVHGYETPVRFCVLGRGLRGSLYPPVVALYRRCSARYIQYGHAHRVRIEGRVVRLGEHLEHDDRKPVSRWLATQQRYMSMEADMLERTPWRKLRASGKVRRCVVFAPFAAIVWCLFAKGLILDGWPGLYYTAQRVIAESLLSLELIGRRIRPRHREIRIMMVLGINAFHADSSASLIADGTLLAAAEEERFRRIKHWAGFPSRSIEFCLRSAGVELREIDIVAINSDPRANRWRRLAHVIAHPPPPQLVAARMKARRHRLGLAAHFERAFAQAPRAASIVHVEHHRAHLASAYYCSGWRRALTLSVDGFGDFASTAWGIGDGRELAIRQRVLFPHSLGVFYQAMTQFLGFPAYGDEYKVMGLAPYGRPRFRDAMSRIVRLTGDGRFALDLELFRHHRARMSQLWEDGVPRFPTLYSPAMSSVLGMPPRTGADLSQAHMDLARSVQERYEDVLMHVLNAALLRGAPPRVALAGGCAMNSVANGRIFERTRVRKIYVQPAAGDAGGALGAALCAHVDAGGEVRNLAMRQAGHGPGFTDAEIDAAIDSQRTAIDEAGCKHVIASGDEELCRWTAEALARVEVVGWFQGRMEWGPRALGHRSILADPRCADMKNVLNAKIKRREPFRPFAPSVLREAVGQWFEVDDDVPFMMKVFRIRPGLRSRIPAVTHVDGSGRLQSVTAADEPLYHRLISRFHGLTGVPMVLNTSFNENEPIVCKPSEAIDCFLRTRMDRLAIGRHVLIRAAV